MGDTPSSSSGGSRRRLNCLQQCGKTIESFGESLLGVSLPQRVGGETLLVEPVASGQ
jgi:hypothetical protein